MRVELLNNTPFALETLLYTKNTRLQNVQSMEEVCQWPIEKKLEHLEYMRDTIQSSWEFVDYTFHISGVTRAFTHQLVRTRTASFAQESQRTVNVTDHDVINTHKDDEELRERFDDYAEKVMEDYGSLIEEGMPVQDARGLLPTNVETSIIVKLNLRTLHDMGLLRLCTRTQGEYQNVFKKMRAAVIKVHPWAEQFIKVHCAWYGVCAFPRYTECPIYSHEIERANREAKASYEKAWEYVEHEAVPVAKDGMTQ